MAESPLFMVSLAGVIILAVGAVIWYSLRQHQEQLRTDDAYLRALEYIADGNDRMAIHTLKEAIRNDTENLNPYLRLGDLLRKRGMHTHAIRIHNDLTLRGGQQPVVRVRILKSLLLDYYASQEWAKGIETAEKALAVQQLPDPQIVSKLVDMQEKTRNWTGAMETARKHAEVLPAEYQRRVAVYLVHQGLEEVESGNGKNGRVKFKEALKVDPGCDAAYYFLGHSYHKEGRLDEAIKYWTDLCYKVPEKSHIVFSDLEKTWYEMGRFSDAENLYLDLLNSDKNAMKAGLALAEFYSKKGEHENAIEVIHRLEENHQISPDLIQKKVNLYYDKGLYKQAASQSLSYLNTIESVNGIEKGWDL